MEKETTKKKRATEVMKPKDKIRACTKAQPVKVQDHRPPRSQQPIWEDEGVVVCKIGVKCSFVPFRCMFPIDKS